jgi:hypothetical protein
VPSAHALVEPIGAEPPWTRATAAYALFGDVMKVNGFSRYPVVDDRGDHVKDEIQNLLQQVGSLVYWSDRAVDGTSGAVARTTGRPDHLLSTVHLARLSCVALH